MGAASSCCSAEPAESKEVVPTDGLVHKKKDGGHQASRYRSATGPLGTVSPADAVKHRCVSEGELRAFQDRLQRSIEVVVLLADGTRLTCDLKLNTPDKTLVISCDTNVREIPLADLKAILHGKDQLRRVETKAPLTEDPNCVALHMITGNCIPIRFDIQDDKNAFIEVMKKLKDPA